MGGWRWTSSVPGGLPRSHFSQWRNPRSSSELQAHHGRGPGRKLQALLHIPTSEQAVGEAAVEDITAPRRIDGLHLVRGPFQKPTLRQRHIASLADGHAGDPRPELRQPPAGLNGFVAPHEGAGKGLRGEEVVADPGKVEDALPERAGIDHDRDPGGLRRSGAGKAGLGKKPVGVKDPRPSNKVAVDLLGPGSRARRPSPEDVPPAGLGLGQGKGKLGTGPLPDQNLARVHPFLIQGTPDHPAEEIVADDAGEDAGYSPPGEGDEGGSHRPAALDDEIRYLALHVRLGIGIHGPDVVKGALPETVYVEGLLHHGTFQALAVLIGVSPPPVTCKRMHVGLSKRQWAGLQETPHFLRNLTKVKG